MKQVTKEEFFSALMAEKKDTRAEISGDFKTVLKYVRKYKESHNIFGYIETKYESGIYPHEETFFLSN
jgi:hypothetical protein